MLILTVGMPNVGLKSDPFQAEAEIVNFSLIVGNGTRHGVYGKTVSQALLTVFMSIFSVCLTCRSYSSTLGGFIR